MRLPTIIAAVIVFLMSTNTCDSAETEQEETPDNNSSKAILCMFYCTTKKLVPRDVSFYICTQKTRKPGEPCKKEKININFLKKSKLYNKEKQHIFVTHGFHNNHQSPVFKAIVPAILDKNDVNVFKVDWSKQANMFYAVPFPHLDPYCICARDFVVAVGEVIGNFIRDIQKNIPGVALANLTLIGHSLGAHISGNAGAHLKNKYKMVVPQIVGLDPPRLGFYHDTLGTRLDASDGEFVHVLHTSWISFEEPIGHADYIFNGGQNQPGCNGACNIVAMPDCDHSRSFDYYAASLKNKFIAYKCYNYALYLTNQCLNAKSKMGGIHLDQNAKGVYHLETNGEYPFLPIDTRRSGSSISRVSVVNDISKELVNFVIQQISFLA